VRNFKKYIAPKSADVVFSNPPFYKSTNFVQDEVKKIAKEDESLPIEDFVSISAKVLKDGGALYCVYGAERSCELIALCQQNGLAVKEMFFTENGKGKTILVVLKCVKGGKNGVKVFPNLVTNDPSGKYLEELHTRHIKIKKD
jgi:tRNA1(Val) A37 N6-methylase TrmN6